MHGQQPDPVALQSFDPEKYASLVKLLTTVYSATGSPMPVLKGFLDVFSYGATDAGESGSHKDADFDQTKAWLVTSIKGMFTDVLTCCWSFFLTHTRIYCVDIIRMFGAEVILLWSALMMKKRVVVYCEKLPILLKFIRCVSQ